ncbi:hypothetical protein EDB89DRAFT_1914322 [Lactarius sanguifluus]|nr:hypothetical protein EDB89DRAFT_1914322 [Lactarius sanguifluus]
MPNVSSARPAAGTLNHGRRPAGGVTTTTVAAASGLQALKIARWNWTKLLAMEEKVKDQEALIEAENKLREAENKYYNEAMERLGEKFGILQQDVLCLRNNFNLCGALEFSLDEYKNLYKIPEVGKTLLLQHLLKQQAYKACLMGVTECYQLQKKDINATPMGTWGNWLL